MTLQVPNFGDSAVLVVGDSMLDKYWYGPTHRISPEAPVPVVKVDSEDARAGGAANVVINLAQLGCKTGFLSHIGQDQDGSKLKDLLKLDLIHPHWITTQRATIAKLRVMSRHQQLIRLDFESAAPEISEILKLTNQFKKIVAPYDLVILSDYGKGTLADTPSLIKLATELDKPVIVDPKGSDFTRYTGATLLTPNVSEFEAIMGVCKHNDDFAEKGQRLIKRLNLTYLLVTRGDQGMSLITKDTPPLHLPAHAKEVYDVTGAGDTVIATLAAVFAQDASITRAITLANFAASIVVSKLGTAWVHPAELRRTVAIHQSNHTGVLSETDLLANIADARAHGERIVMTNGCFDILHSGHVQYLQQAKAQGDRLVVAVNTDTSVKRLKGEKRPINSEKHRMEVLAALKAVDWVIPFQEDTPERLIDLIEPDCLVKGGDYQISEIVGGEKVLARGGEVKALDFQQGFSTTDIIHAIQQQDQQNANETQI